MKQRPATVNLDDRRFDILNGGHSVFSPSGSAMWLWCAGSLIPNLLAGDDAGVEAAEGTVAHEVGEIWLKTGERPSHLIGTTKVVDGFEITITKTMLAYVEEYVDWCNDQKGDHYTETKVWFSDLTPIPKQGGTSDHACVDVRHDFSITITDLKYGTGVMVYAAERLDNPKWCTRVNGKVVKINGNTQAMLYAYGYWRGLPEHERRKIKIIRVRICQPRLGHFQTWETTIHELLDFAAWVRVRAVLAWKPNAPRRPSEKACQWCKVRATCAARVAWLQDLHGSVFDDTASEVSPAMMAGVKEVIDNDLFDPKLLRVADLTTQQIEKLVRFRKVFEDMFSDMAAYLEQQAIAGVPMEANKLVESRSNRKWNKSENAIVKFLREQGVDEMDMYELKFGSPADAEKLLVAAGHRLSESKKLTANLTHKPKGRAILVPLSDPRQPYDAVADDVFADTTADL